jgi:hypothetical protein
VLLSLVRFVSVSGACMPLGVLVVNQNSDSQAEFGVANIHGALQQIQAQMASMNASIHNFRVVSHNSRIRAPQAYSPLQKSVAFLFYFIFASLIRKL